MGLGERFPGALAAARSGAEWAWAALYRDLSPSVLGYLRAQGAVEPEDVLGEVFLHVVRDLPGFAGDERRFRAWVFTIAHHRLLDDRRRRARRPVASDDDAELLVHAAPDDVEHEALKRIRAEDVRALLDGLSPDQRSVLMLRILGDLTVEEVALVLGKRAGAVKALQRRALAALRRAVSSLLGVPL